MRRGVFVMFLVVLSNLHILYAQQVQQLNYGGKLQVQFAPLKAPREVYHPTIQEQKVAVVPFTPTPQSNNTLDSTLENVPLKIVHEYQLPPRKKQKFVFKAIPITNTNKTPSPKFIFKDVAQRNIKYLDKAHGFFANNVGCMVQDSTGAMWFGSQEDGLCKLTGLQMTVYSTRSGFPSNEIHFLLFDKQNRLWIGTSNGFCYMQNDSLYIPQWEHNKNLSIRYFCLDKQNNLWIGTYSDGAYRYSNGEVEQFDTLTGLTHNRIESVLEDTAGNIWLATAAHGFVKYDHHAFYQYYYAPESNFVATNLFHDKGQVWICEFYNGWLKYSNGVFYRYHYHSRQKENLISMVKRGNDYWITDYHHGLFKLSGNKVNQYNSSHGIVEQNLYSLYLDHNANLWVGGLFNGVFRLDNPMFESNNMEQDIPITTAEGIEYDKDSALWFLPNGKSLIRKDQYSTSFYKLHPTESSYIWDAVFTSANQMWTATFSKGIVNIQPKTCYYYLFNNQNIMYDLELVNNSILYAATNDMGIVQYDFKTFYGIDIKQGLASRSIKSLCYNNKNELWALVSNNGINILKGDSLAWLSEQTGLLSNINNYIMQDNKHRMWIGTDKGIQIVADNAFYTISQQNGLLSDNIISIYQYTDHIFWVATDKGLSKIRFIKNQQYRIKNYNQIYGSFVNNFNSTVQETPQGEIYWSTNSGLIKYNPKYEPKYLHVPLFTHEHVLFNDTVIIHSPQYVLPIPASKLLTVKFSAIDWGYEQGLTYRYSITNKPNKPNWVELGAKQDLFFSNITPDKYYLSLQAIGLNGVSDVLTFQLDFEPYWYQTLFFKLMVIFVALTIASLLVYARIKGLKINEQRLLGLVAKQTEVINNEKIELEKKNEQIVAQNKYKDVLIQEIHHRVKNNLQMINSMVDMQRRNVEKESDKEGFTSIYQRVNAMALIHEMFYKTDNFSQINIIEFLGNITKGLSFFYEKAQITFAANTDTLIISINDGVALCLIINEAISNSEKYAFAKIFNPSIAIEIHYDNNHIALKIKDNGTGFNTDAVKNKNTLGLSLIRIFAQQLGAKLSISGSNGTSIELLFKHKTTNV